MTIPFKNIHANNRVPLFYGEVDNSHANSGQLNQRALIIGQITADGAAVPNVPIISQGVNDAKTQGGQGSMLALMTAAYRANDTFGELWYLPLADDPAGEAATGSIDFTTAATGQGALYLYIGGVRIIQPILSTQTTAQLATALAALINATPDLPVSAAVDGVSTHKVNITAVNKGLTGNDIDIRLNYLGTPGGEVMPAGLTVALTQMAGGAVNPSLTAGLANLGDTLFDFIICPYTDTTSLDALKTFLNDVTGRWSWSKQLYGGFFAAYNGTLGAATTLGVTRNDQHGTIMPVYDSPTPSWLWAASYAASAANSLRIDPAMPLQTLVIQGVLAPPLQSRFDLSDRNTLLYDGMSTFTVGDDGTVYIERLITTYQKNAFGNPDDSYLAVEDMYNMAYILRSLKTLVTSKYGRMKLADNGTPIKPGSAIVTPNVIRADLIAHYAALQDDGKVNDADRFAQGLIVERNASDPKRIDVLYDPILIGQLNVFALLFQFLKQ